MKISFFHCTPCQADNGRLREDPFGFTVSYSLALSIFARD